MILQIITHPNPLLETSCAKVSLFDDELRTLAYNMIDVMQAANGIGLAAPQVGILKRLIIVTDADESTEGPIIMVNPYLARIHRGTVVMNEGCLSVPGMFLDIERPARVTVRYQNLKGQNRMRSTSGMLARVVQHEIDHLNGVLFMQRVKK